MAGRVVSRLFQPQRIEEVNYVTVSSRKKETRVTAATHTFKTGLRCSRNDYENMVTPCQDYKTTF